MTATKTYYEKALLRWRWYPVFRTRIETDTLRLGSMRKYATKDTINSNKAVHKATMIKFRRKYGFALYGAPIAVLSPDNYWYKLRHSIQYHKGRIYEIAGYMRLVIEPEPGKYQEFKTRKEML